MIVTTNELRGLRGRVTLVAGGFDPIHDGHVRYFAAAAALGRPVLCSVSSDTWVAGKHAPLLGHEQRAAVIDGFRDIAYVHISPEPTVETLRLVAPCYFAKGDDWRGRLPEDELALCDELGVKIVYLDTVTNSSTDLLERFLERHRTANA